MSLILGDEKGGRTGRGQCSFSYSTSCYNYFLIFTIFLHFLGKH